LDPELVSRALGSLLSESFDGPTETASWVFDRGDTGLLGTLRALSADHASRTPASGGATIAAHAGHLNYHLSLLNRWAAGEPNPFADADWPGSWQARVGSDEEWGALVAELERGAGTWIAALQEPREWDEIALTGALASAVHIAYHTGSIRQLAAHLTR
jgi:hypothetical protein